jgi:hypothetical protein
VTTDPFDAALETVEARAAREKALIPPLVPHDPAYAAAHARMMARPAPACGVPFPERPEDVWPTLLAIVNGARAKPAEMTDEQLRRERDRQMRIAERLITEETA